MKKLLPIQEKGVTLISLVVTIIVMMIIGGVTANVLNQHNAKKSADNVVKHATNAITADNKVVEDEEKGNWYGVINQTGIEKSVEERN